MPYELEKEDVVVCGETLTVSQASNAQDLKRSLLIEEAREAEKAYKEKDTELRYMRTLLYPSLVACTTGNVPSIEEFLYGIPVEDSDRWIEAARRKNSRWFSFLQPASENEAESNEKKE